MPKNRLQPVRPTVGAAELTRPSTDATRQKQELFVAALEQAFDLIQSTLSDGADSSADQTPDGVLSAMGATYATLISNRDLLMLQVFATLRCRYAGDRRGLSQGASNDRQVREQPFRRSRRCGATVLRLRPVMPLDHDDIA
jgi:hypothetical protein